MAAAEERLIGFSLSLLWGGVKELYNNAACMKFSGKLNTKLWRVLYEIETTLMCKYYTSLLSFHVAWNGT
jgi:hypothetical protein